MQFICDSPDGMTWFRIETEVEAERESELMNHAVAKHFRREREAAIHTYTPTSSVSFERNIGLATHIARAMPVFATLRDRDGAGHATAMLPPGGSDDAGFRMIIVGPANSDPYSAHGPAIAALGAHFGLTLDRARCYPYVR